MSDVKKVHVEGKLYDIKDPKSVCTIVPAGYFPTLDSFVRATNFDAEARDRGYSFRFQDTGGWGPRKTKDDWYRCLIVRYQNRVDVTQYDVYGTVILTTGPSIYLGYITGTTTFTVTWYSLVEEGGTMREAVPASLGGNCALNGHFVAGHTGWTAMTSHDQNNINTRYRFQLGGDGVLYVFKTTQGDGGYSAIGRVLRDDQISTWSTKTPSSNTTYVTSQGSYTICYYNSAIKLASLHMNLNITTQIPPNSMILGGLPKPFHNIGTSAAAAGGTSGGGNGCRLYIHKNGGIYSDQLIPTGWFNGSVTYPYSSL